MKKIELWVDESGKFNDLKNKYNSKKEGSLVGGILCVDCNEKTLKLETLIDKTIHANELDKKVRGEYVLPVLESARKRGANFVVFQNDKKALIVDSVSTYLNVFAEGVSRLAEDLIEKYGNIELDITYAQRKDTTKDEECRDIILYKDYEKRIREKLEIQFVKDGVNRKKIKYNLTRVKANKEREDKKNLRVDLADLVCNTYLIRNSFTYNDEQKKKIEELYKNQYVYSVFQNSVEERVEKYFREKDYAEIIMEIANFPNVQYFLKYINKLTPKLNMMDDAFLKIQLSEVTTKLGFLIKYIRDNDLNRKTIENIKKYICVGLDDSKQAIGEFKLNLELLLLEVANHTGDNELEEQCIANLLNLMKRNRPNIENLGQYYRILIRKAVYENNIFDFQAAIKTISEIIDNLEDKISVILLDTLGDGIKIAGSDVLGKAYGTRLQARIFLVRNQREQLEKAEKDFEKALNQFVNETDKSQQYQYRCDLYSEVGEYEKALTSLALSLDLKDYNSSSDFSNIVQAIELKEKNIFEIEHLMRIVGLSSFDKIDFSNNLFSVIVNSNIYEYVKLDNVEYEYHPMQIILWNMGRYYLNTNSNKAAIQYYDKAISICFKNKGCYTMRGIGLGILSEIIALMYSKDCIQEARKYEKKLIKEFKNFKCECENKNIYKYFIKMEHVILNLSKMDNNEKAQDLLKISELVTY